MIVELVETNGCYYMLKRTVRIGMYVQHLVRLISYSRMLYLDEPRPTSLNPEEVISIK